MLSLTTAIIASSEGYPITSLVSRKTYYPEELDGRRLSDTSAVFNSGVISADERKGEFIVKIPRKSSGRLFYRAIGYALKE